MKKFRRSYPGYESKTFCSRHATTVDNDACWYGSKTQHSVCIDTKSREDGMGMESDDQRTNGKSTYESVGKKMKIQAFCMIHPFRRCRRRRRRRHGWHYFVMWNINQEIQCNAIQYNSEKTANWFLFPYLPIPHFQEDVHFVVMDMVIMIGRRGGGRGHRRRVAVCRDDKSSHNYSRSFWVVIFFCLCDWITALLAVVDCDLWPDREQNKTKQGSRKQALGKTECKINYQWYSILHCIA